MRVLVIGAHPDDTEFISGGTIALMTERGDDVRYLIVTSGELGLPPDEQQLDVRENEQLSAAKILRVQSVEFLREVDGSVMDGLHLRSKIVKTIRTFRPELIITHSPNYNLKSVRFSHPDHLAVGRAVLASVFPGARNPKAYPEHFNNGLGPWSVPEAWLVGVEKCNHVIDISSQFDTKLSAIQQHHSQMRHFADATVFFREWADEIAQCHGLAPGTLAEEFYRMSTI
ncbi:MAG: PIG-L deacetylase family protein [Blastocatellia bacterium]